jgi:hypothetical protein
MRQAVKPSAKKAVLPCFGLRPADAYGSTAMRTKGRKEDTRSSVSSPKERNPIADAEEPSKGTGIAPSRK